MQTVRLARRSVMGTSWLLVALVALLVGAAAPVAAKDDLPVVTAGTTGMNGIYYLPIWTAWEKGWFEEEGVRFEMVQMSDPDAVRAVASGTIGLAIPEAGSAIQAAERGADVIIVASLADRFPYDLVVRKGIESFEDLRGKRLAHWQTSPSIPLVLLERLMAANGLQPGDYTIIRGGNVASRFAAVSSGAVDGAILTVPQTVYAEREGLKLLGGFYDIPLSFAAIVTSEKWAEAHREELIAWLRAVVRGIRYVQDPANRDDAVRIFATAKNLPEDVVARAYDMLYQENFAVVSWDLLPNRNSFETALQVLADVGEIPNPHPPVGRYVRPQYLHRALGDLADR